MNTQSIPLIDILAQVPDWRNPKGRRHPLSAILALACAAMMCGYRSYSAIAQWGRNYGEPLIQALGFTMPKTPCAATFYNVFARLSLAQLETQLATWAETVLQTTPTESQTDEPIAIDGKTLRGSAKQGARISHLLSAVSHRLGLTLFQQAVSLKTNEIPVIIDLLSSLVVDGRVITVDALLTQPKIAKTIVAHGGHYIMPVKANQPNLLAEIRLVFTEPNLLTDTHRTCEVTDLCHGRIETRRLICSTALVGYSQWPGLQQVFRLDREVVFKKTEQTRHQVIYGVTSLTPEQATAEQLLGMVRGHWCIENKSHWVRDVTFDEDRSRVRSGNIPQVMAALRNTAIGLMRNAGFTNIAAAARYFAARPTQALAQIGIQLEN